MVGVGVMDRCSFKKSGEVCESLVKARKRHFDSRWRANIASCFETLLHVVPMSKRAIKKQSKAKILDATAQHLEFLERTVVLLLQEKAKVLGVRDEYRWCANEIEQLKASFVSKEISKPRKPVRGRQKSKHARVKNKSKRLTVEHIDRSRVNEERQPYDAEPTSQGTSELQDYVKESLCCKEELGGSDDEGIQSASSLDMTPKMTFTPTLKMPKKIRKLSLSLGVQKSRRSLIEQLNAQDSSGLECSPTNNVSHGNLFLDENLDPWLSSRFVLRAEDGHSNIEEVNYDESVVDQAEFWGQNSPLFGLELEHLLHTY